MLAAEVYRDYEISGIPASGPHQPDKRDVRAWGASLEALTSGLQAGGGLAFLTLSGASANLGYPGSQVAWVVQDGANNGVYVKVGATGTGSWQKVAELPYSFARYVGSGTANAIIATSATQPSVSDDALRVFNVPATNTSSTVTVRFDGGSVLTIKTSSGLAPAIGSIVGGMLLAGYRSGSNFCLITDLASTAIQIAAETARAGAETARDLAVQAADQAAVVGAGDVPTYGSIALAAASTIPAARQYILVMGKSTIGDLRMPTMFVRRTGPSSGLGFRSTDRQLPVLGGTDATNGGYWEARTLRFTPQMFDAAANGTTDDKAAFINAATILSALGGGILEVPRGDYGIGTGGVLLTGLSNVVIVGVGGRASRLKKLSGFTGVAGLVFAGCDNCTATGIYIDANGQDGNGIAAAPSNAAALTGTRSTNIGIYNCDVTLQPTSHNYGIAMFLVQGGAVIDNRVDGQTTALSTAGEQEGIECFGCSDVVVAFNRIRRISGNALSLFSAAGYDAQQRNVQMVHNTAEDCYGLVWINPSMGRIGSGTRYVNHFLNIDVSHNTGRRIFGRGIRLALDAGDGSVDTGLIVKNVTITHNKISFATAAEGAVASSFPMAGFGAALTNGSPPSDTTKYAGYNIVHEHNVYEGGLDAAGSMLNILLMSGVTSRFNRYSRVSALVEGSNGAYVYVTERCSVIDEHLHCMDAFGILVEGANKTLRVDRNEIVDWDQGDYGAPPILFNAGSTSDVLSVRDNVIRRPTGSMTSESIVGISNSANHNNFEISGNRYFGTGNFAAEVGFSAAPGSNGNRGTVTMSGGATSFTVATNRCSADSTVIVTQQSGTAQAVTRVAPGDGTFTVTLAAATNGSVYRWRII